MHPKRLTDRAAQLAENASGRGLTSFVASGCAVLLVSLIVGGCGAQAVHLSSPASTHTPAAATPTPSPGPQAFSSLYGYELVLPPHWRIRPATTNGFSGTMEGGCANTGWDCFGGPSGRSIDVAAMDVPATNTLKDWQAQIDATTPVFCKDADPPKATTFGGGPALAWTAVCLDEGLDVINLVTIHETRGYFLFMTSTTRNGFASDQKALDSMLATFHFTNGAS